MGTTRGGFRAVPQPLDFMATVRIHGATLRRMASCLTRNYSDASDLFQDTIEHALRAKRQDVEACSALPWLVTIMRNSFIDTCRERKRRRMALDSIDLIGCCADRGQAPPARWRYVDDELLARSIGELPSTAAAMLRMSLDGVRYTDLAARLEIPMSTVGTRLHRIRRRLRARLCSVISEVVE